MPIDRRTAIQWMMAASAALQAPSLSFAADAAAAPATITGYGKDPNLTKDYRPGDLWPLTFTASQRKTAAALCDLIIPPEGDVPAASALGVVEFIDEWISSPYEAGQRDKPVVIEGLRWLDEQSRSRFGADFAAITPAQRTTICDELVATPATPALLKPSAYFMRYRDLTAIGFYTTPVGMKDIGYRGNVPLASYDGPPQEVLAKLGM
ncbi:MAG TPA: gluconate 2-dehydrogenase subunit 3 family protein [Povalibacter sp.]|nr:gluconate 2-dehydrogenase subunit 3 family protein [Povalibacter sp.]